MAGATSLDDADPATPSAIPGEAASAARVVTPARRTARQVAEPAPDREAAPKPRADEAPAAGGPETSQTEGPRTSEPDERQRPSEPDVEPSAAGEAEPAPDAPAVAAVEDAPAAADGNGGSASEPIAIRPDRGAARALVRSSTQMATFPAVTPPPERSGLERLDAVVVPRLQAGARATAHVATAPLRTVARAEEAVAGTAVRWGVRNRQAIVLAVTLLAVAGSAIHLQRYPDIQQAEADRRAAAAEQTVSEPGRVGGSPEDALAGGSQVVGPTLGVDASRYVAQRHAALADVPVDEVRVAVVSFREYVTPAEALAGVPEGARIHAAQLRIPVVGEEPFQTEIIENDLVGSIERAMSAPMAAFAEEEAALEELIPTVNDPTFRQVYEQDLERLRTIRNLVNSGAGTVFSLVIEAPAGELFDLTLVEEVRLVDVAPGETDASRSGFYGLLPEDRRDVTYGVAA